MIRDRQQDGSAPALRRRVGRKIRELRVEAGLTQEQVGERAGYTGKYVGEIERGLRDASLGTLASVVERGVGAELAEVFAPPPAGVAEGVAGFTSRAPLPRRVELLARDVAALPADRRELVITILRAALGLAR